MHRSLGFKNPLGPCSRARELHAGSSAAKVAAPLRKDGVCRGLARYESNQTTYNTTFLRYELSRLEFFVYSGSGGGAAVVCSRFRPPSMAGQSSSGGQGADLGSGSAPQEGAVQHSAVQQPAPASVRDAGIASGGAPPSAPSSVFCPRQGSAPGRSRFTHVISTGATG